MNFTRHGACGARLVKYSPEPQIGNQSPFYFIGLWFWRQIVGDSEVGLRFSSMLAVAASSVVLTVGVARWTKSFAAGVMAGLVIALESNAIFFGTELRPYAFVILFASVAVACFLRLSATESRHQHRRYWSAMIIAILLAALSQPTSIGVLACLPLILCCVWLLRDRRQLWKVTLLDIMLGLMVPAVGFALWRITLGDTWQQRSNWGTFAEATRVSSNRGSLGLEVAARHSAQRGARCGDSRHTPKDNFIQP